MREEYKKQGTLMGRALFLAEKEGFAPLPPVAIFSLFASNQFSARVLVFKSFKSSLKK